jgi:hypothetical protein
MTSSPKSVILGDLDTVLGIGRLENAASAASVFFPSL